MKYGKWSEIPLIKMPVVDGLKLCVSLHRKLSIMVQFLSENLVGRVI